ncbi:2-dehydropantoate 2-reductase [Bacterioplanes sanyensis]|nr:2-dehydropantoate 2-reductase [Bacterioplanes sanyensis]
MRIVVYGAGSIGCYLGASLHSAGLDSVLLGRERLQQVLEQHGAIELSDYQGAQQRVTDVPYHTDPKVLAQADIVLVTLKCLAMEDAAQQLANYCRPATRVVCLQNGLGSDLAVRQQCQGLKILRGIVGFNVVGDGAHFHRATEGDVHMEHDPLLMPIQHAWQRQGIACELNSEFDRIAWAKLQLNLNNVINALSDLPLKAQLEQRAYRRVLAMAMQELVDVAQAKGIELAQLTALPATWLPKLMNVPDWLFKRLAKRMLAIDPEARSSMWEDIQHGRPTEILFLNGAVASEGEQEGIATPVNHALARLMWAVEQGKRPTGMSGPELLAAVTS